MKKWISLAMMLIIFESSTYTQSFNSKKIDSLFETLSTNDKYMGSVAILENGKLIYSKSIGKENIETKKLASSNSKYFISSISKIFTSCLVLKAVEENKLSLSESLDKYFPTIANAKKITLENLLNNSSGIHSFSKEPAFISNQTHSIGEAKMIEIIANGKSDFEPNSKHVFCHSNYVLMSYILEKVYKKPFGEILKEKITAPLDLKSTCFSTGAIENKCASYRYNGSWEKVTETDISNHMGSGGILSNANDLAVFMNALFSGKIVGEKSIAQIRTIKDNVGLGVSEIPFGDKKGLGVSNTGIDGFTNSAVYFPDSKLAVAITSNGSVYPTTDVMKGILNVYYGKAFEIPNFDVPKSMESNEEKVIELPQNGKSIDGTSDVSLFFKNPLFIKGILIFILGFIAKILLQYFYYKMIRPTFFKSYFKIYRKMDFGMVDNAQSIKYMFSSNFLVPVIIFSYLYAFWLIIKALYSININ